jgi:hypothetical protein
MSKIEQEKRQLLSQSYKFLRVVVFHREKGPNWFSTNLSNYNNIQI